MKMHWAHWLILGGLGADLIDAVTTKPGATGGALYGAGAPLSFLNNQISKISPVATLWPGEVLAMVGVIFAIVKKRPVG